MNKLIISNSQGTWLDTDGIPYTKLIADRNTFCYVKSGLGVNEINEKFDEIFKTNNIDIVVIQIGIIEISNRIIHDKTKKILSNLPLIGKVITKIIWKNKYNWLRLKKYIGLRDYQKMNCKEFNLVYSKLCSKLLSLNIKKIYIVGVPNLNSHYLNNQNPFINTFIKEANQELKKMENKIIKYIDVENLLSYNNEYFTKNTVHFSKLGHERLAIYLKKHIKELNNDIQIT